MFINIVLLLLLSLRISYGTLTITILGSERGWPFADLNFLYPIQSPVDIITSKATSRIFPELQFVSHLSKNVKTVVNNTGHTVYVFLSDDYSFRQEPPYVVGGPLGYKYYFEQLHMHWGSTDKWGSEHFIDGESFSIEGHAVHYNSKYGSVEEASKYKDGLVVLTIFAEATNESNPLLDPLVEVLHDIPEAGMYKILPSSAALSWFLSARTVNDYYYTYPGSLTTSPYSENVIFILFPKPITLSYQQLKEFRTLHHIENGEYILENKRQLQPLNYRPVLRACINPIECMSKLFL